MSALAETAVQAATSWPAVALGITATIGGWGTVLIRSWAESRRTADTAEQVGKIKDQVTNGGSNLATTVGEVKQMLTEQRADISGLRADIGGLREELRDERRARVELARTVEEIMRDGRTDQP